MLNPTEEVFQKPIGSGLTLRTVSTSAELDRVAEINAVIHEPSTGEMTRKMFSSHPDLTGRDLVYIENDQGEAIATLCLIPWTLRYGEVEIPAAELGIVGTLEQYRGKSLNRILMDYFWQRFAERGALVSIIQGIPYFYRQYNYEYALLPLEGGWRIQPDQIPSPVVQGYTARPAKFEDIPLLTHLYNQWTDSLDLSNRRSESVWKYLLERTPNEESMQHDTMILEDPAGQPAGYFRIPHFHFYQNLLTIDEVSQVDFFAGMAVLDILRKMARERAKDGIRLYLPQTSGLLQIARSFGAQDMGRYSWQVSIPDRAAFLRRMGPVFEKRLSGSLFAGLTGTYSLNLYKEVIGLTFQNGRLEAVTPAKEDNNTLLNIPPIQFIPLAMGGSRLDEIQAAFPDAFSRGPWKLLVDTLFPKVNSFLATIY